MAPVGRPPKKRPPAPSPPPPPPRAQDDDSTTAISSPNGVVVLCEHLFGLLQCQLPLVLSGAAFSPDPTTPGVQFSPGDFVHLLRFCMASLQSLLLLPDFTGLARDKSRILVHLLRHLCHPTSLSHIASDTPDGGGDTAANPVGGIPASFLCLMIEVFVHQFSLHNQLRRDIMDTYYETSTSEMLFVIHCGRGDINVILELVSSHFLLSVHNEEAVRFMQSLSYSVEVDKEIPEVGVSVALQLLGISIRYSAPHMLLAHLIMLVSRCIDSHMATDDMESNLTLMNHQITALELSVNLYARDMSALNSVDNFIVCEESEDLPNWCFKEPTFGSCVRGLTCHEVNHQVDKLVNFCHQHSHGVPSKTKVGMVNNLKAFIIEHQHIIDEMFKDDIHLILNHIILIADPGETDINTLREGEKIIHQEIYCVAAVLKLMSSLLLQILWHWKKNGYSIGLKNFKNRVFHKQFSFVSDVISRLGKCGSCQPIQMHVFNVMETNHKYEKVKLMLAHFASLLSYSFKRRLAFLSRGCIIMIMALMNIVLFEDGNLDLFRPLLDNAKESTFPQKSLKKPTEGSIHRRSIEKIALNFQNTRKVYFTDQLKLTYKNPRTDTKCDDIIKKDAHSGVHACSGEAFISCLPDYQKNPSQYDDLADFIVCTPGKHYPDYLKKKCRFFTWQQKRKFKGRREQKKLKAMLLDKMI